MFYTKDTMNYPKKPGFNLYQSRHRVVTNRAYITYSVKAWFLKNLSEYNDKLYSSTWIICVVLECKIKLLPQYSAFFKNDILKLLHTHFFIYIPVSIPKL